MTQLYVGNLPVDVEAGTLEQIFSRFGRVRSVTLHADANDPGGRRWGLVEMPGHNEAARASRLLNGQALRGRFLAVHPLAGDPGAVH